MCLGLWVLAGFAVGCGGASGTATVTSSERPLLPAESGRGMGPPGPGSLTRRDTRVLGVIHPGRRGQRYFVPVFRGVPVRMRAICHRGDGGPANAVTVRWNGRMRSVSCRMPARTMGLGRSAATNALEVLPVHASVAPDVVIEQPVRVAVTPDGRGGGFPPSDAGPRTGAVEILPGTDPNAIRREDVPIGAETRLQVETNAPGTVVILVDGRPVDLAGEAHRRSASGVWTGTTRGITSAGSITSDVLFAAAPAAIAGRTVVVTVIPQHFSARGWRVSVR